MERRLRHAAGGGGELDAAADDGQLAPERALVARRALGDQQLAHDGLALPREAADGAGVARHVAPAERLLALLDGDAHAQLLAAQPQRGIGRQEAHRDRVVAGRRQLELELGAAEAAQQAVGHLQHQPGAVARVGIGPARPAVLHRGAASRAPARRARGCAAPSARAISPRPQASCSKRGSYNGFAASACTQLKPTRVLNQSESTFRASSDPNDSMRRCQVRNVRAGPDLAVPSRLPACEPHRFWLGCLAAVRADRGAGCALGRLACAPELPAAARGRARRGRPRALGALPARRALAGRCPDRGRRADRGRLLRAARGPRARGGEPAARRRGRGRRARAHARRGRQARAGPHPLRPRPGRRDHARRRPCRRCRRPSAAATWAATIPAPAARARSSSAVTAASVPRAPRR